MNKIKTFLTTVSCLLLTLAGCQDIDHEGGAQDVGQVSKRLRVNYIVNNANANGTTRATIAPELGEDSVQTLKMFFFESTTDGLGEFIESYTVPEDSLVGQTTSGSIDIEFASGSKLNNTTEYVVLVMANAPDDIYNATDISFANENEISFISNTLCRVDGKLDTDPVTYDAYPYAQSPIRQGHLVMSQRIVKPDADQVLNVQLSRVVSRFDIKCAVADYTIVSASVWNAAKTTQIWPGGSTFSTTQTRRFYGIQAVAGAIQGGLYAFENYVNAPVQNDKVTTCLVLGLLKQGETAPKYYRLNIVKDGHQYLKRNNVYQIMVSRVRGDGANSELDAWSQAEFLLDVNVNGWTVDPDGTVLTDEDGNMLAVGSRNVVVPAPAGSTDVTVFTVGSKTLRLQTVSLPAGMSAVLIGGDVLRFSYDSATVDRGGFVDLEYGKLVARVSIKQQIVAAYYLSITPNDPQIVNGNADLVIPNIVKVTSSGPWTAKIYNPGFTFVQGQSVTDIHGDNGDPVNLFTATANTDVQPRAAFVLFSLDADPEITATLVLQQRGTGGISYSPADVSKLEFNADGVLKPAGSFDPLVGFTVITDQSSANTEWVADLSGQDAGAFALSATSGDYVNNLVNVAATQNITNRPLSATLTIRLKNLPSIFRTIQIAQDVETISLNPATVSSTMSAVGDSVEITVTSSKPWVASIALSGASARLSKTSGLSGETFKVIFDKNLNYSAPTVSPEAVVTVGVQGTAVAQSLTIKQAKLTPVPVRLVNHYGNYPNAVGNNRSDNARYIYEYLTNTSYFGPTGTVYTLSAISITNSGRNNGSLSSPIITSDDNIYWENIAYSANYIAECIAWKQANPQNVLVVIPRDIGYYVDDLLKAVAPGYDAVKVTTDNVPRNSDFSVQEAKTYCDTHSVGSKVWNYLLDGPFGKVTDMTIVYTASQWPGNVENGITGYPSTMIPVLMRNGACSVGIDPVNNVIIMNAQAFNQYVWGDTTNPAQHNLFEPDSQKGIFLRNLLAFIVNSAQYGSDFSKAFAD